MNEFNIRDLRNGDWLWMMKESLEKIQSHFKESSKAIAVYTQLCYYANYNTGKCFPSITTIAEKLGISRRHVIRILNDLESINLIKREIKDGLNTTYNLLKTGSIPSVTSDIMDMGLVTPQPQTSDTTDTLNRISKENKYKDNVPDPENLKIAELLKAEIKEKDYGAVITDAQIRQWADVVRLMVDRDKRTLVEIRSLLVWASRHHFWKTNILSMGTFREKFTRLTIQKKTEEKGHNSLQKREGSLNYVAKKQPIKEI